MPTLWQAQLLSGREFSIEGDLYDTRYVVYIGSSNFLCHQMGYLTDRPGAARTLSLTRRRGMGSHPIVVGRSLRGCQSLVHPMDRSCTEYKSLGRGLHTPASPPNTSRFETTATTTTDDNVTLPNLTTTAPGQTSEKRLKSRKMCTKGNPIYRNQ